MRGAPRSGKDTFISFNNLQEYSLSADNIRIMMESPIMTLDGRRGISQKNDGKVWALLYEVLEQRMRRGEFVIINATHSKESDGARYKKLIDKYRYRAHYVDFSDVALEELLARNVRSEEYKQVPEHVIHNMYSRMQSQKLPNYIKRVAPVDFAHHIQFNKVDFNKYKRIAIIGDLHGCSNPLADYFTKYPFSKDTMYIYLGDYVDRGIRHQELFEILIPQIDEENTLFLPGNHEYHLMNYLWGDEVKSQTFLKDTLPQLENVMPKLKGFVRRLGQCAYFDFDGREFFCCHGGLSNLPQNLNMLATDIMIRGVGRYEEVLEVAENWVLNTEAIQFFGHRGMGNEAKLNDQCYVLEDNVEFGGNLRIAHIEHGKEPEVFSFKNDVYKIQNAPLKISLTNDNLYDILTTDKNIQVKHFKDDIVSCNFKNSVFFKGNWNNRTTKARGLFLSKKNKNIIARAYDKFFNIGERRETEIISLQKNLEFPVTPYLKYNGFLGLLSWNPTTDDFFFSSKTSPDSDFTQWFKDIFWDNKYLKVDVIREKVKEGYTLVFEVIDPVNDPHIVEYWSPRLVLLDAVKNQIDYQKMPYNELNQFAKMAGLHDVKMRLPILNNWNEFQDEYNHNESYFDAGVGIEGYIYEDAKGFMVKYKTPWYKSWKAMRQLKDRVKNRRPVKTSGLQTPTENEFYAWCKKQSFETLSKDIIQLRNEFYEIST